GRDALQAALLLGSGRGPSHQEESKPPKDFRLPATQCRILLLPPPLPRAPFGSGTATGWQSEFAFRCSVSRWFVSCLHAYSRSRLRPCPRIGCLLRFSWKSAPELIPWSATCVVRGVMIQ